MKLCNKCKETKDLSCFSKDFYQKDGLNTQCKECRNEYKKEWYKKNKDKCIAYATDRVQANREHIYKYLLEHPCCSCGESDPVVLDFDHIDPKDKHKNISWAINKWSWSRIKKEMSKCQILCANCHRRKTAESQGWYKFKQNRAISIL